MARITAEIKVNVIAVAEATTKTGKSFYQIVGRHNGETVVIGASVESLPMAPEAMANREVTLPLTIKGDRMDLWLQKQDEGKK